MGHLLRQFLPERYGGYPRILTHHVQRDLSDSLYTNAINVPAVGTWNWSDSQLSIAPNNAAFSASITVQIMPFSPLSSGKDTEQGQYSSLRPLLCGIYRVLVGPGNTVCRWSMRSAGIAGIPRSFSHPSWSWSHVFFHTKENKRRKKQKSPLLFFYSISLL